VKGNTLVDEAGNVVQLRGVNRMGTDYACIVGGGFGIFSGPDTTGANAATLNAMSNGWHIDAVRTPLNEDCWLDRENLDRRYVGEHYRTAITEWINQITALGMAAIVELHWSAPAGVKAEGQQAMPDADNSVDFWKSVADNFKDNPLVIFDLHNEPYPDRDLSRPAHPWDIWLNGGTLHLGDPPPADQPAPPPADPPTPTYAAVGMQALVSAVRQTGATNPIMVGGLDYADDLKGIVDHLPVDPLHQLIASWHVYPGNNCGLRQQACWEATIAPVLAKMPVVAGELGRKDCLADDLVAFMTWMDAHGGSYLAWVWTITEGDAGAPPEDKCRGRYDLIDDYVSGNPTVTGATIRNHYLLF
jgi:hypothetical protein